MPNEPTIVIEQLKMSIPCITQRNYEVFRILQSIGWYCNLKIEICIFIASMIAAMQNNIIFNEGHDGLLDFCLKCPKIPRNYNLICMYKTFFVKEGIVVAYLYALTVVLVLQIM